MESVIQMQNKLSKTIYALENTDHQATMTFDLHKCVVCWSKIRTEIILYNETRDIIYLPTLRM